MSEITKEQLEKMVSEIAEQVMERKLDAQSDAEKDTKAAELIEAAALETPSSRSAKPKRSSEEVSRFLGDTILTLAAAKGDTERAAKHAAKVYGKDDPVTKALLAAEGDAGGFLIQEDYASDVIELLRPASVVRSQNPIIIPMPKGTFTLPKLAGGATASYISESENLPVTEPSLGQLKLTFKKLAAIVPISNDLIRYSTPQASEVVTNDLVSAIGQREDLAYLRNDGTLDTPRGLKSWVPAANVTTANATVNLANVTTDLGAAVLTLMGGNVRMIRPAWFMAPRSFMYLATVRDANGNMAYREELMQGRLWTYPVGITTQIPVNLGTTGNSSEVYLCDMADAVIGEATSLLLDTSAEAAYHDGSAVVAAYSKDQTVIRAILEHDFGMRHNASIAMLEEVRWTI